MNEEKTFFKKLDITVTSSRFVVGSKTYAIRNIVSTRGLEIRPNLFGLIFGAKKEYQVILQTSAGDVQAYQSTDPEVVSDLLAALDKAIAAC
jgi:hypothetical protein